MSIHLWGGNDVTYAYIEHMDRRKFLKTLGLAGLAPMLPSPILASVPNPAPAAIVPASTYKWAEVIVRAHNKCNLSMLERLLNLDPATAGALKTQLIENGVITATKSRYGIHSAVKPLYQEVFPRPQNPLDKLGRKIEELVGETSEGPEAASVDTDDETAVDRLSQREDRAAGNSESLDADAEEDTDPEEQATKRS